MAAANDLLVNRRWAGASLRVLLVRTLTPFGVGPGRQVELIGPDVVIPAHNATSLALGIHEMATNAAKYGAFTREDGIVRIGWAISDVAARPRLRLIWPRAAAPKSLRRSARGSGPALSSAFSPGRPAARPRSTTSQRALSCWLKSRWRPASEARRSNPRMLTPTVQPFADGATQHAKLNGAFLEGCQSPLVAHMVPKTPPPPDEVSAG